MNDLQVHQRCKLRKKRALGPKWHRSFRIRRLFRFVASSYELRLPYVEGILLKALDSFSRLSC